MRSSTDGLLYITNVKSICEKIGLGSSGLNAPLIGLCVLMKELSRTRQLLWGDAASTNRQPQLFGNRGQATDMDQH
jgi:hypothetical protein